MLIVFCAERPSKVFHNNRHRQQHPTPLSKRSTSHSHQRSITQQKHWQGQSPFSVQQTSQTLHTTKTSTYFYPLPKGGTFFTWSFNTKGQLTLYTFLISIYNRSVIPMFTPFKLQDTWTLRSPPSKKHIGKWFSHITKCHLLQKVFKLQVL